MDDKQQTDMNNSTPLVSVIMPTYNTIKYIGKAIESVLQQTYKHFELVIVNDGSTDNTRELVAAINDPRIRYYELEKNMGRGFARNFAISKCTGEFIAICDADDISLPERLQLQVAYFQAHTDIDIVGGQLLHFADNTRPVKLYSFPESPEQVKEFFRKGYMGVPHASCMVKKYCFEKCQYENKISYNVEDFELFLRLNRFFKMASLPQALVLYRNNLSVVTYERIRHHELYHSYSIYISNAKLNGESYQSFEEWSAPKRSSLKHQLNAAKSYLKIRVKDLLRNITVQKSF